MSAGTPTPTTNTTRQRVGRALPWALALAGLFLAAAVPAQEGPPPKDSAAARLEDFDRLLQSAAEKVRRAVVSITAEHERANARPGQEKVRKVSLSGTLWDEQGRIVTLGRELKSAKSITVRLAGSKDEVPARLVGVDPETDIAVLEAKLPGARALSHAPGSPRVGALVLAAGNSFGLEGSVSIANIAGLKREMRAEGLRFTDALQTTAPVNPGDPGGALANSRGELIGILATALRGGGVASFERRMAQMLFERLRKRGGEPEDEARFLDELADQRLRLGAQNIGFAIPLTTVKAAIQRIAGLSRTPPVTLGTGVRPLPGLVRRELKIAKGVGVLVVEVSRDSPAARAGVAPLDIILSWNGSDVTSIYQLRSLVVAAKPGDKVELRLIRDGRPRTVKVELTAR